MLITSKIWQKKFNIVKTKWKPWFIYYYLKATYWLSFSSWIWTRHSCFRLNLSCNVCNSFSSLLFASFQLMLASFPTALSSFVSFAVSIFDVFSTFSSPTFVVTDVIEDSLSLCPSVSLILWWKSVLKKRENVC